MIKRAFSILSILLILPAVSLAAPATTDTCPAPEVSSTPETPAELAPATAPLATPADLDGVVSGCPGSFCSSQERTQCGIRCHHHGIGLLCDFSTCTSQCICGSVPPGLEPMESSPASPPDLSLTASGCGGSFCS